MDRNVRRYEISVTRGIAFLSP